MHIISQRPGHGNLETAEGAHKGGKSPRAGHPANDGAQDAVFLIEKKQQFQHDFIRSFGSCRQIEFGE